MNSAFKIDNKTNYYRLLLVNDDTVNGNEVFGALLLYFINLNPEGVIQIMRAAEKYGETSLMIAPQKECTRALDFFKTLKIPVRMEKYQK